MFSEHYIIIIFDLYFRTKTYKPDENNGVSDKKSETSFSISAQLMALEEFTG